MAEIFHLTVNVYDSLKRLKCQKVVATCKYLRRKAYLLALALIISLTLFFRLYNLTNYPEWYIDEGIYAILGRNIFHGVFRQDSQATMSWSPCFPFLVGLSLFLGNNFFYVRLVPAIFGIITTLMIYTLGRKLYNKPAGLLAAFFHSISLYVIFHERSAFMDVGMEFFFLLSLLLSLKYIENPKDKWLMLTAFVSGLGAITKISGIIIPVSIMIIFVIFKRPPKKVLTYGFSSLLIFLAWITFLFLKDPTDVMKNFSVLANMPPGIPIIDALTRDWGFGAHFRLLGLASLFYLAIKFEKKHVFILMPMIVLFFFFSRGVGTYYFVGIACFLSLAAGKFMMDSLEDKNGVLLIPGLLLFLVCIFFPDQLLAARGYSTWIYYGGRGTPYSINLHGYIPVLYSPIVLLVPFMLKALSQITSKRHLLKRPSIVFGLIFLAMISSVVIYHNYEIISMDTSFNERAVVEYLNSHTNEHDIVYIEPIFVFQLKCDARDNGFVNNLTIHEAKYAVTDPFWNIFDKNLFYDVDIGTPRNWITSHWILEASFGQYDIYANPSKMG